MAQLHGPYSAAFKQYHHRLMIRMTIQNKDAFSLQFVGEYFDTGKRFEQNQPGVTNIALDQYHPIFGEIYHYVCNQSLAITGVSGGMMYKYNGLYLYIGFSNPLIGCMKCFVDLSDKKKSAQWAYDQIYDGEAKSARYKDREVTASFDDMSDKPVLDIFLL